MKLEFISEIDEYATNLKEALEGTGFDSLEALEEELGAAYVSPQPERESAAKARAGEREWAQQMSFGRTQPGQDPAGRQHQRAQGQVGRPQPGDWIMMGGKALIIGSPDTPGAQMYPRDETVLVDPRSKKIVDTVSTRALNSNAFHSKKVGDKVSWAPRQQGAY